MPNTHVLSSADDEHAATAAAAQAFIERWRGVSASELATAQSFVIELCELLGVPRPTHEPHDMFERPITFQHGDGSTSAGRVDCYKRGHFVWESKKLKAGVAAQARGITTTKAFDDALLKARTQAEAEARAVADDSGRDGTDDDSDGAAPTVASKPAAAAQPWPPTSPEQVRQVAQLLATSPAPLPLAAIEASFKGKGPWKKGLPRILDTLEALGRARQESGGWRG